MPDWTYVVADLLTDTTLEELPLDCQSFERKVRGYGDLRASLPLTIDDVAALDLRSLLRTGERALYVMRDGEIVWGGILWRANRPQGSHRIDLQASEFESFFQRVLLTEDYAPKQVDQLDIFRELVRRVQATPARDLQIRAAGDLSGILRDRQYLGADRPKVGQLLQDLANVDGGFDYAIDTTQDADGRRTRLLRLGYPRLGRSISDGLVFEASIVDWTDDYDAWGSATELHERGATITGTDPQRALLAVAQDTAGLGRGQPLLQDVVSDHSTVSDQGTLDAWARSDLAAVPLPVVTYSCVVRADGRSNADPTKPAGEPVIGSYQPGDEALFEVTDDWHRERGDGSPGLSVGLRILAAAVDPKADTVTLTLGPPVPGRDPTRRADRFLRRLDRIDLLLDAVLRRGAPG